MGIRIRRKSISENTNTFLRVKHVKGQCGSDGNPGTFVIGCKIKMVTVSKFSNQQVKGVWSTNAKHTKTDGEAWSPSFYLPKAIDRIHAATTGRAGHPDTVVNIAFAVVARVTRDAVTDVDVGLGLCACGSVLTGLAVTLANVCLTRATRKTWSDKKRSISKYCNIR